MEAAIVESAVSTIRLPGSTRVAEGDRLPLAVPADAIHLFDRDSGARI